MLPLNNNSVMVLLVHPSQYTPLGPHWRGSQHRGHICSVRPIEYSWLRAQHIKVPVIIPTELTKGQSSVARCVSIHQPHHTPAIQLEAVIVTVRYDICRFNIFSINYRFTIYRFLLRIGILFGLEIICNGSIYGIHESVRWNSKRGNQIGHCRYFLQPPGIIFHDNLTAL